jgi:hypothetical protein
MGPAHAEHLKRPQTTSSGNAKRFTRERKNLTKGLLERWNMLPLKMDMILIDTDPSDVNILATFSNAAKIRIYRVRELTPTIVGGRESPDRDAAVLGRWPLRSEWEGKGMEEMTIEMVRA